MVRVALDAMDHVAAHLAEADESDLHGLELLLDRVDVAGADADRGQAVVAQRLQIAVRLGSDQRGERVRLAGNLEVLAGFVDELQEAPDLRAALVELPGRVQEPRAVAPRGG